MIHKLILVPSIVAFIFSTGAELYVQRQITPLPIVNQLQIVQSAQPVVKTEVKLPVVKKKTKPKKKVSPTTQNRVKRVRKFLNRYKSPLAAHAELIVAEADRQRIDWRIVAAISIKESTGCRYRPALVKGNCWGILGFTPKRHIKYLGSLPDGVRYASRYLRQQYYNHGRTSTYTIGQKYCPPTWRNWASSVQGYMNQI